jgi:hypothetical protein
MSNNLETAIVAYLLLAFAIGCDDSSSVPEEADQPVGAAVPQEKKSERTEAPAPAKVQDDQSGKTARTRLYSITEEDACTYFYPRWNLADDKLSRDVDRLLPELFGIMRLEYDGRNSSSPSWAAVAFCVLLDSPRADEIFKKLLCDKDTRMGTRLYALCGVYWTDRKIFKKYLSDFRDCDEDIEESSGCFIYRRKVKDIVARIENGYLPHMLMCYSWKPEYIKIHKQWCERRPRR